MDKQSTIVALRKKFRRMSNDAALVVARAAIDEILARGLLKCADAMTILEFISPDRAKLGRTASERSLK